MLKIRKNINVLIVLIGFSQFSCSFENDGVSKEYEKNWIDCYKEHLIFHADDSIVGDNYVKCVLNNRNVLINSSNSNFIGSRFYYTSGSTSDPQIPLPVQGTRYRIGLAFIDYNNYWTNFSLILDYKPDSINYLIQKTFSRPYINCSTNLIDRDAAFVIEADCSTGIQVNFSTFYAEVEEQKIKIDSFSYVSDAFNCYYHLEYSANNLEITNSSWNSSSKYNHGDVNMKSKILIENLPVKDIKVVIDFDFPIDQ